MFASGKHPNSQVAIRDPAASALALKRSQQARSARARLNALIDLKLGDGGEEALDFIVEVFRGNATGPSRKPSPGEDLASFASTVPQVGPTIRERLDAAMWLQEQRNGKARQSMEIEGQGVVAIIPVDLSAYNDQELEIAELLLTKGQQKDPGLSTVDAEFTEVVK